MPIDVVADLDPCVGTGGLKNPRVSRLDGVDARAVRRLDVQSNVQRAWPQLVEARTQRMLTVKWPQRPAFERAPGATPGRAGESVDVQRDGLLGPGSPVAASCGKGEHRGDLA